MNKILHILRSLFSGDELRMADGLLSVPKNRPSDGMGSRSRLKRRGMNTCYAAKILEGVKLDQIGGDD